MRYFLLSLCLIVSSFVYGAETKNVIWVIGDGMGPDALGFFMEGVRYAGLAQYPSNTSFLEQLMNQSVWGLFFNNTYDTLVTDSAASATQMATGKLSRPEFIGVDYNGNPTETLLEMAHKKGLSVGIISDAYVTDATPAAFTAHAQNRKLKYEIARQQVAFGPEVILGGGLKYFTQKENKNLLKIAQQKGYHVVRTKKELTKINKGKVLGLFADKALPMAVELYKHPQIPSLVEQTQKAIEILSQNTEGFILMVEAGKIDWAAHANDAGAWFQEMQVMDELLGYLKTYVDQTGDTLLYVNADHDTGLGGFGYRHVGKEQAQARTEQGEVLYGGDTDYASFAVYHQFVNQKGSLYYAQKELEKMRPSERTPQVIQKRLSEALGYEVDLAIFTDLSDVKLIFKELNESRGLIFATQNHSSLPIMSLAYGEGKSAFAGVYHNTDILPRLKQVLGW